MIALLVLAQLAASSPLDSAYSSPELRTLVARAAAANHAPPQTFGGYRARVESELSLIMRDTLGREQIAQIEQLASSVHWTRGADYDMRVVGYRSQGVGVPYSTLTFVKGWTEPSLYGERLMIGAQFADSTTRRQPPPSREDSIVGVHPLAADRDLYYRFSGGDTIAVLNTSQRLIHVVRIRVTPHLVGSTRLAAFDGELQLDAERGQIVRMRGQFVVLGSSARRRSWVTRIPGIVAVAYCDFVNAEVNGRYWLPASQRSEFQTAFALLGRSRAVMRIVSRFSDYTVDERADTLLAVDDTHRIRHRTAWAPSDSISGFGAWQSPLGSATTEVNANDFDDIAPDVWRATGGVRFDAMPTRASNLVRYNRVEGLFTGAEGSVRMRSVVPGLSASARAGWAWTERTARGGASVSLQRSAWTYGARAERLLASTNDFRQPFESESAGPEALLASIDDFDYVDRRIATGSITKVLGSLSTGIASLQLGVGDDRAERSRLTRGWRGRDAFLPNRGVMSGTYALAIAEVELHPSVSGDFLVPGVGGKLRYEMGNGALRWDRAELSVAARQYWHSITFALHADGGAVFGSVIPPQTLFELGGSGSLPGYTYKEFTGDRAALVRSYASYTLPLWRTPRRVWRAIVLPGLAPGFAAGVQAGWTDLSSAAARTSAAALSVPGIMTPTSQATNGVRATVGAGLTFFGGNVHVGVARAVDHSAPWKFVAGLGQLF